MPIALSQKQQSIAIRQATDELFTRYLANPNTPQGRRYRDQIHEYNMPLARKVAHDAAKQCTEAYEDLEQIAMIGLLKAIERFDPSKGFAFSSHATPWIKGEIQHYLRDHWPEGLDVPRRWVELHQSVLRCQKRLQRKGRELSEEAIALAMGCTPTNWRRIKEGMQRTPILDIDEVHAVSENELAIEHYWRPESDPQLPQKTLDAIAQIEQPYQSLLLEAFFYGLTLSQIAQRRRETEFEVRVQLQTGILILGECDRA